MSNSTDLGFGLLTRREALGATAALATLPRFDQKQPKPFHNAINSHGILKGAVKYPSGDDTMDAFLSRPKRGAHPAVIVVAGNVITEEYIPNTTALLAQSGFVGIAPNIFRLQSARLTPEEKAEIFRTKMTDELIFRDIEATVSYLRTRSYTSNGKIGIMGFCFGGRIALMFSARSAEIGAVVPFYGNLVAPPEANRHSNPVDLVDKIHAPVQGHFAKRDKGIPLDQLHKFEKCLKDTGTDVEIFEYDVDHGFFAYTRPSFDEHASETAWSRSIAFFHKHLRT